MNIPNLFITLEKSGLNTSQLRVLCALTYNGESRNIQIADITGMSPQLIQRTFNQLKTYGLVTAERRVTIDTLHPYGKPINYYKTSSNGDKAVRALENSLTKK